MDIDWPALRAEYVAGTDGYRKLAQRHGISFSGLYDRAARENWSAERKKYREKRGTELVARYARMDRRKMEALFRASEKMAQRLETMMEDDTQFNRYLVREKQTGELRAETLDVYNTKAMKNTVSMLREMSGVLRSLNRIPTQAEAEAQHIARRRMELEEKKLAGAEAEDTETGAILIEREEAPPEPPAEET